MSTTFRIAFLTAWALCLASPLSAQPVGAKSMSTPNGKIWLVDESWFEKDPPFLEFYTFGERDGLKLDGSALLLLQDSRGDIWLLSKPLKDLEEILPKDLFFRIHHSYLLNLQHVIRYIRGAGGEAVMVSGEQLPVARNRKNDFLGRLGLVG